MKSVIVLGIVAILCPSFSLSLPRKPTRGQEPIGEIEYECPWDGVFKSDESCELFIECWSDVATLWQCTDLMLFDLTYFGCNFAQYVHCEDRPRPTGVPGTTNTPITTTTSDPNVTTSSTERPSEEYDCPSDGVFQHDEFCEYYWECYGGEAKLVHCQSDFLFDLTYMGCNYPELTHCQDRERPPGVKPTTNPPPGTTTTKATTTEGPTTEYTGPSTSPTTTVTTTTEKPGEDFKCPITPIEGDLYADPLDCSCFYACTGGIPIHNCCPDHLFFNPELNICDYPANVDCEDRRKNY